MAEEQEQEQSFEEAFEEFADPSEHEEDFEGTPAEDEVAVAEESEDDEPSMEDRLAALEAERDDWQHKYTSQQGRVAAMQRDQNVLQEQLENQQAPTKAQVEEAAEDEEKWKELSEDFPEFVDALNDRLGKMSRDYERKIDEKLGSIAGRLDERDAVELGKRFETQVTEAYADWREIVNTSEFKTFLDQQPQPVQAMYTSDSPDDAIYLLDRFTEINKPDNDVQVVKKQRQERLKRNVSTPRTGAGGRNGPPDDFDAAWDYFARQK